MVIASLIYVLLAALAVAFPDMLIGILYYICKSFVDALLILDPDVVWSAMGNIQLADSYTLNTGLIDIASFLGVVLVALSLINVLLSPFSGKNSVQSPFNIAVRGVAGLIACRSIAYPLSKGIWELFSRLQIEFLTLAKEELDFNPVELDAIVNKLPDSTPIGGAAEIAGAASDIGGVGNFFAYLMAGLIIIVVLWNFIKLILELVQRVAASLFYVLLSPLAVVTMSTSGTSSIASKWFQGLFTQCILMVLNGWTIVIGSQAVDMIYMETNNGIMFFAYALFAYAILKVLQQLDDLFNSVGANVLRQNGDITGDIFGMRSAIGGIAGMFSGYSAAKAAMRMGENNIADTAQKLKNADLNHKGMDRSQMTWGQKAAHTAAGVFSKTLLGSAATGLTKGGAILAQGNKEHNAAKNRNATLKNAQGNVGKIMQNGKKAANLDNAADKFAGAVNNGFQAAQADPTAENVKGAKNELSSANQSMDAAARQGIKDNFADKVESDIHAKNNNERNQINAEKSNAMNEAVTAMNAAGVAGKTSESAINNFKSSSTALAAANESFERASAKSDVLKNDSVKDSIQNNGSISPEIASDYRSKMESAAQVRDEKAAAHAAIMNDSNSTAEAKMTSANELKAAQESYESSARQYNAVSSINSEISKSGAANGVDAYAKVSSSTGEELKAATTNRESAQVAYNAAAQEVSNVASTAQAVWNDSAVSNDVKAHGSISDATMEGIATQYGADSTQYEMAQSLNEKAASIKNANPSASNDAVYDTVSKGVNNLTTSGPDNILTSSMDDFNKSSEKMAFVDTQEAAMQTSAREDIRAGFKAIDKSYNDFAHSDGADNEIDTFKQYQASISAMENTVSKYVSPESAEQTFHERYGDATKEYANEVRNASRQMWNDVESSGALSDPAMNQYAKKILHSEGATDATLDFDETTGVLTGRVYNRAEIKDSEGNVTGARESYTTYNDVRGTVTDSSGEEKLGYVSKVDYTTTSSASNPNFATVTISDGNGEFFKPTGLTERGSDGHYRLKPEFEGRVPISVYDDGQNGVGASMNLNISFDGRQDVDGNNVVRVGVAGAKDGSFVEYHGKDLTAESMAERIRTGDFSNIEAKTTNGPQNSMLMQILRNSSRRMGRPKMGRRRNSNMNKTYKSNKK